MLTPKSYYKNNTSIIVVTILVFICVENLDAQGGWHFPPNFGLVLDWDTNITQTNTWTGRYRTAVIEIIAKECGFSRVCNTSGLDPALNKRKECTPCERCYCDDVCMTYGDCCIDKILDDVIKDKAILDNTPLLTSETSYSSCFDEKVRHSSRLAGQHRLISSCPRDYKNNDVITNCERGQRPPFRVDAKTKVEVDDLFDVWPVMSKRTKIHYRNRACAECHEDQANTEFWGLATSKGTSAVMPPGLTKTELLEHVLNDPFWEASFTPPSNEETRVCIHDSYRSDYPASAEENRLTFKKDVLGTCNITGERDEFDPVLWEACRKFPTNVLQMSRLYANLFCYLCQVNFVPRLDVACGYQTKFNFFFMISPDTVDKVVSSSEKCSCPWNQAVDPLTNTCHNVMCPQGFKLSRDDHDEQSVGSDFRCVDDGLESKGLMYSLNIDMTSTVAIPPLELSPDEFQKITDQIEIQLIMKVDPFQTSNHEIVTFLTYLHPASQARNLTIGMSASVYFTENMSPSVLAASLISVTESTWRIDFTNETISFQAANSPGVINQIEDVAYQNAGQVAFSHYPNSDGNEMVMTSIPKLKYQKIVSESAVIKNVLTCPYIIVNEHLEKYFIIAASEKGREHSILKDVNTLEYNGTGTIRFYFTYFDYLPSGKIIVCAEDILKSWQETIDKKEKEESVNFGKGLEWTSAVCLSISCLCLTLTLVTYALFPSLRTLPGKNTMALVASILFTMVMVLVTPLVDTDTVTCQIVGVANHYFLLSSVTWMVICTFMMFRIFSRLLDSTQGRNDSSCSWFLKYMSVSILIPASIVIITIIVNYLYHHLEENDDGDDKSGNNNNTKLNNSSLSQNQNMTEISENHTTGKSCEVTSHLVTIGYGGGVCYLNNKASVLLAAGLPIILAVFTNCVFFFMTLHSMRKMTSDEKMIKKEPRSQMFIYIKLCTLTGLNWIPGLTSVFVESKVLWYAFIILAGLQGLYVFIAFVLNARVIKMYKVKFRYKLKAKESSSNSSNVKVTKETSLSKTNTIQQRPLGDDKIFQNTKCGDDNTKHLDVLVLDDVRFEEKGKI